MRFYFLSIVLVFPVYVLFGQTSLSAGANFRLERPTKLNYDQERSVSPLNTYFVISVDQQIKKWQLNADFMLLNHNSKIIQFYAGPWSHPSPYPDVFYRNSYKAKIVYSYASFKLGTGRTFKFGNTASILIGLFGQFDYLINEKETNHQSDKSTMYYNWYMNFQTGQKESNPTTTDVTSYNAFDAVTMAKKIYSGGIHIKPRFIFKHFFTELNFSAGIANRTRVMYNISDHPDYRRIYAEAGLKIGYTFR